MDITEPLPARDTRGTEIQGIIMDTLRYKSEFHVVLGTTIVDWGAAANTSVVLAWIYYKKWRMAGIGWECHTENFTDDEDPELSFGIYGDTDYFGKLKVTYPASEKMVIDDIITHDEKTPTLLGSRLGEAETGITFTAGDPDGNMVWQNNPHKIRVENTAQLTTGQGYPFALIEVSRV